MVQLSSDPPLLARHSPDTRTRGAAQMSTSRRHEQPDPGRSPPITLSSLSPAIALHFVLTRRLSGVHAAVHRGLEAGGAEWT